MKIRTYRQLIGLSLIMIGHIAFSTALTACSDWSDHYGETAVGSTQVDTYNGDIVSYLKQATDLTQYSGMLQDAGIYDSTYTDRPYTFVVCSDQVFGNGSSITNKQQLAQLSVSDMAIEPNKLTDGFGIRTRSGKNIWVYGQQPNVKLDNYNIVKTVKTNNGYVYYIDGIIPVRVSVYEYLHSLDDAQYSTFKRLVANNEELFFDREHSQPLSVNNEGMVVYDSVKIVRNELMDRYTQDGIATWNMRDESYVTTMFIPTNAQIEQAVQTALDSVQQWKAFTDEQGHYLKDFTDEVRTRYKEKFENWIVRACFVDRRLNDADVVPTAPDFDCVGDYQMIIDKQADKTYYSQSSTVEAARWRPSVQTVDVSKKVTLSNGVAYFCTNLKIPTHIIIYRMKSKFYQLWDVIGHDEETTPTHFRTSHWIEPKVPDNAFQTQFVLTAEMDTMVYKMLSYIPDEEAMKDSLPCSVEYDGLQYFKDKGTVEECNLPAGEYYLRMGFVHSLNYSVSIIFEGDTLVKDMVLYAQGSNYHFDRGAASPTPLSGDLTIAYREGYDPNMYMDLDEKAIAYDTDGYTVAIVNLKHSGNFKIKVESKDQAYLYDPTLARNQRNKKQFLMYHWCLRPTKNNY